jgi:DnaJ-class molecular chaperone
MNALVDLIIEVLLLRVCEAVGVALTHKEPCHACGGTGRLPEPFDHEKCPLCEGKGKVHG